MVFVSVLSWGVRSLPSSRYGESLLVSSAYSSVDLVAMVCSSSSSVYIHVYVYIQYARIEVGTSFDDIIKTLTSDCMQ